MESRRRKAKARTPRRVNAETASSAASASSTSATLVLPNLEAFLETDDPQISIGVIGPIQCAVVSADPHNMLAALVRRPGETLQQLLERLDAAVLLAMEQDIFTDDINPPSSRR
ncbi:MAG TPA: hypothetical protein VNU21_05985 [Usitatibacter sp.]|nr:hypothetical protein [Usitatibacter sp.]